MANPTFNSFSVQDDNFITERIVFKGFPRREVITANVNRREGIKLIATEFADKEITLSGRVIATTSIELQSLLDNFKKALTAEEADLVIESDRTFTATVKTITIPDEHYNNSTAPFAVTFVCSDPFARGSQLSAVITVPSGIVTISGVITISGTLFNRPTITYIPPSNTGNTLIKRFDLYHIESGQTVSVSGFGAGAGLAYQNSVVINLDDFTSLEGGTLIDNSGAFPRFEPGSNTFTLTASGRRFPGGTVQVSYQPRYL